MTQPPCKRDSADPHDNIFISSRTINHTTKANKQAHSMLHHNCTTMPMCTTSAPQDHTSHTTTRVTNALLSKKDDESYAPLRLLPPSSDKGDRDVFKPLNRNVVEANIEGVATFDQLQYFWRRLNRLLP